MPATLPKPTDVLPEPFRAAPALPPTLQGAHRRADRAHRLVARVLLGGLALQLFFAGLGVFGSTTFLPQVILGTTIVLTSLALPLLAWQGHLAGDVLQRSLLLAGLMILQGALIDVGREVHIVAALHPVNAMLLVLVTYGLAGRELWRQA
jgi:hypothetical protein